MRVRAGLAGLIAPLALGLCLAAPAAAEPVAAIIPGNVLVTFDTATPNNVTTVGAVTGLGASQTIRGIDVRPATGEVYISTSITGAASNSAVSTYTLNTSTAAATLVGTLGPPPTLPADVPTGYDFNPVADRIRYVNTNDENFRIHPAVGLLFVDDTNLTPAATTTIIAEAYDRNKPGQTATTLYSIDRNDSQLGIQGGINGTPSPNGGVITDLAPLGVTLNAANDGGFDISPSGTAYAALTDAADNITRLYRIELVTGVQAGAVATNLGLVGNGTIEVRTITILSDDRDADGVLSSTDNCAAAANADQANTDGDPAGNACDEDDDGDGVSDAGEAAFGMNPGSGDSDGDGVPDGTDLCPRVAAATATGCNENQNQNPAPLGLILSGFPSTIKLNTLKSKGVLLTAEPDSAASFVAELRGNRGLAKAKAGDLVLAETSLKSATGKRSMRLRVPKSLRRRLKVKAKLTLRLTATNALGQSRVVTRSLRIN